MAKPKKAPVDPNKLIDERLAASARAKLARGEAPTARETLSLNRVDRDLIADYGARYVRQVPQATYLEWVGRTQRVVRAQADHFGMPFLGKSINVPEVLRRLHDVLAQVRANAIPPAQRAAESSDEAGKDNRSATAEIRLLEAKADLVEDERDVKRQELLPRASVHEIHSRMARVLRSMGERIGKNYGPHAHRMVNEALDDYEHLIDAFMEQPDTDDFEE